MEYKSIARTIALVMIGYNVFADDNITSVKGLILWSLVYIVLYMGNTNQIVEIKVTAEEDTGKVLDIEVGTKKQSHKKTEDDTTT